MAYGIPVLDITLRAAADLSENQFYFAAVDTDGFADLPAGAGDPIAGVIQNKPGAATGAADEAASIRVYGVSKVVLGDTVAAGDLVTTDATGAAVTAATGDYVAGVALMGGDAGEIVSVLLTHGGYVPA